MFHFLKMLPTLPYYLPLYLINSNYEGIRVIEFYSWEDFKENLINPLIIVEEIDV